LKKLLTNTFGIDSRCFVCDPDNEAGLRQSFYLDDDEGVVVAQFTPGYDPSGAPKYAHGGVSMAILDDAMAWAVIALRQRFGLTRRAEIDFARAVRVGVRHDVCAWVEEFDGRRLIARAELRDDAGFPCVSARAEYVVITMEEARKAIGAAGPISPEYVAPSS
jgi:acyl-coenzyme A thioesterase PaaI-like protein